MTAPTSGARTPHPANDRPDVSDASLGDLIGEVAKDLSTLLRQELELAKAELRQEAVKTGKAAGALSGAGIAGHLVLVFLSFALWWGLNAVMDGGWAAVIVAALWAVIAAVLYTIGRQRLRQVRPTPDRTVETLKEVPDALRGR